MADQETVHWLCKVCGYVHEGAAPPETCPVCGAPSDSFEQQAAGEKTEPEGEYLARWARKTDAFEEKFSRIVQLAKTGVSEISPMRTQRPFPGWETILFRGAQLSRLPLNEDEPVDTRTIIGSGAAAPLELDLPFYVSHMSFGALSREAKITLARGSRLTGTAIGSGEGGLLPEEREEAGAYIYELGTATFSHKEEAIRQADAVEIKIGQAAKPGLGGHLPGEKVTEEIAAIRGLSPGEASISPGRPAGIDRPEDLARRVAWVRGLAEGRPVGIKIAAGHVEHDLECLLPARPDFITLDCRGGGTGAAPDYVKDHVCLPPIFAIRRARRYLDGAGCEATLCVTGGFRDSTDIAKALALGADAVALATASLIAIGCQQYRVCHTGACPVGITTQNPELRARFEVERSVERLVNFYRATVEELRNLARINGRNSVHALDLSDVVTISDQIARYTDIEHA